MAASVVGIAFDVVTTEIRGKVRGATDNPAAEDLISNARVRLSAKIRHATAAVGGRVRKQPYLLPVSLVNCTCWTSHLEAGGQKNGLCGSEEGLWQKK